MNEVKDDLAENYVNKPLRERFDYLANFLDFTANDILILNKLGQLANDLIPSLVDQIFQRLLDCEQTRKYFLLGHFGYAGTMIVESSQLTLQSEQMAFRRTSLGKYFKRILRQRVWNDAFLHYLSNVGLIHTNLAGSQSINVEYIHINVLFGYIEHLLLQLLLSNEQLDAQVKQSTILALNKFFWIQNDFFAMHYLKASDSMLVPPPGNCRCS